MVSASDSEGAGATSTTAAGSSGASWAAAPRPVVELLSPFFFLGGIHDVMSTRQSSVQTEDVQKNQRFVYDSTVL